MNERKSGVLLHVSSLPSGFGIGTFGKGAKGFVDFLADSGFRVWQVLPFCMADDYNSPYKSRAAFGVNPYFIDPEILLEKGYITESELDGARESNEYLTEYDRLHKDRISLLSRAADRAKGKSGFSLRLSAFYKKYPELLTAARFLALKEKHMGAPWQEWDEGCECDPHTLYVWKFIQYEFFSEWLELKSYANSRGVEIIGDMPMYVDLDSADVWSATHLFKLDSNGYPTEVAGVPPDAFSAEGQLWGNPLYDYASMKRDGYAFWRRRMEYMLTLFDGVRIDHFRALEAYYSIPVEAKSAKEGRWIKGPGRELVDVIREVAGDSLVIAEDLGVITDEVRELLEYSTLPGMRVLQFAFSEGCDNLHLPHNYTKNTVVYTGTHDNNTTLGYLYEASDWERTRALEYCSASSHDLRSAVLDFIKAILRSSADIAIIPMQDILGYGADTRMNTPGVPTGNWRYRLANWQLDSVNRELWHRLNSLYSRI
ncbi:MAG: 4-alpha-glucanotransferase [Clostridia bacterium]|nr:4-alpha-glucanotransferase [Clostridia bacterium]